ncbi:MAG: MFS transporter [Alphaproteobacteria bacterium]|nr:MFS transporter [Alphaproteobacteria bacterium]
MVTRLTSIAALLMGTLVFMLGNGLLGTLVAVRLDKAGYDTVVAGAVMAAYFVGLIAGCLRAGLIVAAVGHIRAFAVFAGSSAALAATFTLVSDPIAWALLRFLGGFAIAGLFMVIESWLNEATENEWRGRILSTYMVVVYVSLGIGQLLLGIYPIDGPKLFTVVSMLFALSLIPVSMTRQAAPMIPETEIMRLRELFDISPLGAVGSAAAGLLLGAFYGLTPIFAQRVGLDVNGVALLMAAAIVGGLVVQFPVGALGDRFDRRKVLTAALWIVCASAIAVSFASLSGSFWLIAVCAAGLCCAFVIYPLAVGHANDRVQGGSRIAIAGGLLLTYSSGAVLGPLLAAGVMNLAGPYGLFIYLAAVAALTGGFAFYRMRAKSAVPADEQGAAQYMPRTSPVAPVLDPSVEEEPETVEIRAG